MATQTARTQSQPRNMAELQRLVAQEASWKTEDESRLMPAPKIHSDKKYLFRFLPGTGPPNVKLYIDKMPDDFINDRQENFHKRSYSRRTARVHGAEPKYDLESIREKVGGNWLRFKARPGSQGKVSATCYYDTDDPEIAAFIRNKMRMGKGFWRYLREEHPSQTVEINGISVPNTSEGWEVARKAAERAALALDEE